jgi:hypothetical protein
MTAPIITGLLDPLYGEVGFCSLPEYTDKAACLGDGGDWTTPWPPVGYLQFADSVQIGYASNGLPAGYTDRFYVSDVSVNSAADGVLAATVSDTGQTSVTLTGLAAGRDHHVRAFRYNGSGVYTGELSNRQFVRTSLDATDVTPANLNITANWSTDKFNDWFRASMGAEHLTYTRQNDGVLGNFIRMVNSVEGFNTGFIGLDGRKFLSPRHDWSIEIPCRIAYTPGAENQFQIGFNSGCQNIVAVEVRDGHATQENKETSAGIANVLTGPEAANGRLGLWGTMYGSQTAVTHKGASTAWRLTPSSSDAAEYSKWMMPNTGVQTLKYIYTAADRTVRVYIHRSTDAVPQDLLLVELGPTHDLITQRRKFPQGHYPLPVTPSMRFQDLIYGNNVTIDIGAVKLTSACPYEYAGWAAESGHHGSYSAQNNEGVHNYDPATHTLDNLRYWQGDGPNRYTVNMFSGYTVPRSGIASDYPIYPDSAGAYSQALISSKGQPIAVPVGKSHAYFAFQAINQYGATIAESGNVGIEARLVDQADTPLTSWRQIGGVYDTALSDTSLAAATSIRAEVRMQYNGAAIVNTTTAVGDNFEAPLPNSPPVFVGSEVYFTTPPPPTASNDHPTGTYYGTQTVTLTPNSTAAAIFYTLDGSDPTSADTLYAAPIEIAASATLRVIAYDSEDVPGDVQTFTYTILPPLLEADPVTVTPSISEAQLTGVLSADSVAAAPSVSAAELVGTLTADSVAITPAVSEALLVGALAADSVTITPAVSTAELAGILSADDVAVTPVVTVAELQAALTGSGSIRSPSGAVVARYLADGTPVTNYRYISGVWQ